MKPRAYSKTRGTRSAMERVGTVKRAKKARELAVPAVEEWEEATRDEVVEEAGEIVEKPAEEVLGMDAVQDKEEAVAEKIENSTEEEVAAEVEPVTEEGEEESSEMEADTTGEAVENPVQSNFLARMPYKARWWRMPY